MSLRELTIDVKRGKKNIRVDITPEVSKSNTIMSNIDLELVKTGNDEVWEVMGMLECT